MYMAKIQIATLMHSIVLFLFSMYAATIALNTEESLWYYQFWSQGNAISLLLTGRCRWLLILLSATAPLRLPLPYRCFSYEVAPVAVDTGSMSLLEGPLCSRSSLRLLRVLYRVHSLLAWYSTISQWLAPSSMLQLIFEVNKSYRLLAMLGLTQ